MARDHRPDRVDCCAPQGSGIVTRLNELGRDAHGADDALGSFQADWIVTNPPYQRGLVDRIATACLDRLRLADVRGVAFLMRANWDLAACRAQLFYRPWYAGQTRMRFRPWWSEDRSAQPIHNFCWFVWQRWPHEPITRYWP